MPENLDFEKAMQQQLDGFQVTPAPSDWNAVYDRLHPQKKRRPIWWWMPALLIMVAIGWYISKEPNGAGQAAKTNTENNGGSHISTNEPATINQKRQTQTEAENGNDKMGKNEPAGNNAIIQHVGQADGKGMENISPKSSSAKGNDAVEKNGETASKKVEIIIGTNSPAANRKSEQNTDASLVMQSGLVVPQPNANAEIAHREMEAFPVNHHPLLQHASVNKLVPAAAILQSPIAHKPTYHAAGKMHVEIKNAKTLNWEWGLYAGAGANRLTKPIVLSKALADNLSTTPGSLRRVTTTTQQNGWHYNAGVFVSRKWNSNWQFTTGFGLNASNWKTSSATFIDSILPAGNFYSRALVSTVQKNNTLYMAELPLQISNRIAGKSVGTFWWTAGINNQFLLTLKQRTNSSTVQNNFATTTDEKSLTSGVNKYQPQLRAGFMYDHAGKKSHWQLQPLLNISLVKPLASGDFNLMNLQLQGRWFFRKK
jgi:hypothetical protein